MDMETYSALFDGNAVTLCTDRDFQLEGLAQGFGGRTEMHSLLMQPLTGDGLLMACAGFERPGMSDLAVQREREAALKAVREHSDVMRVNAGLMSRDDFAAKHFPQEQAAEPI